MQSIADLSEIRLNDSNCDSINNSVANMNHLLPSNGRGSISSNLNFEKDKNFNFFQKSE